MDLLGYLTSLMDLHWEGVFGFQVTICCAFWLSSNKMFGVWLSSNKMFGVWLEIDKMLGVLFCTSLA
jgi:hypothetical protein